MNEQRLTRQNEVNANEYALRWFRACCRALQFLGPGLLTRPTNSSLQVPAPKASSRARTPVGSCRCRVHETAGLPSLKERARGSPETRKTYRPDPTPASSLHPFVSHLQESIARATIDQAQRHTKRRESPGARTLSASCIKQSRNSTSHPALPDVFLNHSVASAILLPRRTGGSHNILRDGKALRRR